MTPTHLFLEGRWQDGGSTSSVLSPFDGTPITEVAVASAAQVDRAVGYAVERARHVRRVPLYRRAEVLARVASLLQREEETLTTVIRDEAGKPVQYARAEVRRAVDLFTVAAAEARRQDGAAFPLDTVPRGDGRWGLVRRFPVGVVTAITPFNFPLNLVAHKVAPAVVAGCPVVVKPAPQAPSAALHLARLLEEAGLVEGALQVLPAANADAERLVTDDRVAMLSFTGSAEVGWRLKSLSGRKRVALELGGSAAVLFLPDADEQAVMTSLGVGAYAYAGQVCISVQRILVPRERVASFTESFVAHVRAHVPSGDPRDPNVVNGPLVDGGAADRVLSWVEEARGMGARVLCGGQRTGNVVTPVVVTDVDPRARVHAEEVFGPVVCVEGYTDLEDGIRRVNATRWGLQVGVFTNDLKALWRCHDELEVGAVIHNDTPTFRVDPMPYGGVKDSGLGREGIRYAVEEMTEPRLLALRP